uniref:RNA recognition motif domain-containing protein n=1 Tax=Suricata suricatta TaxID=37032 RepID=A0A673SL81_SURSU
MKKKDTSKKSDSNALMEIVKCPTKVVLLWKVVGTGELDEDLEAETKAECEKHGKVGKCEISELPGAPDNEAVQIFLEFERAKSAINAIVDPNGRYFGGRVVKACFYNPGKLRFLDSAEHV